MESFCFIFVNLLHKILWEKLPSCLISKHKALRTTVSYARNTHSIKVFCVMLRKFIGFCIENNITSATVVYGILDAKCN